MNIGDWIWLAGFNEMQGLNSAFFAPGARGTNFFWEALWDGRRATPFLAATMIMWTKWVVLGGRLVGADRHEWSHDARDQFFGPEPSLEDPLPAHRQAIEACRALLTESYQRSLDAVSANETTRQFLGLLSPSEWGDVPLADAPMRVVLMGRTMAGKSTLLAALTGSSEERIGDGRQRYSRDVFAARALQLDNVEIVDTPGVGAKDGEDDLAQAMAQVSGADLILWIASNDSFQEETAQALRAVALRGKPVVVALNCRAPLADDLDREDFLEDQDAVFAQHEGHFERSVPIFPRRPYARSPR